MDQFNTVIDWIINNLGTTAIMVGMVLEFLFRLTPTAKPWSVLLIVKAVVAKLAAALGKISEYLDKVIPQNIK